MLAPLALEGTIDYVGIDPDEEHIAQLKLRWPWADLRAIGAEAFSQATHEEGERFDHILVLRSWNHLKDPARFLSGLRSYMREGATLTIVDNVAFGLARTHAQTKRAEAGPALFEHYRNDSSVEAEAWIARLDLPVEREERMPVGPGSSNQWLLRYRWRAT